MMHNFAVGHGLFNILASSRLLCSGRGSRCDACSLFMSLSFGEEECAEVRLLSQGMAGDSWNGLTSCHWVVAAGDTLVAGAARGGDAEHPTLTLGHHSWQKFAMPLG